MKKYRVWLYGSSMTATYDGYVDVIVENEEQMRCTKFKA